MLKLGIPIVRIKHAETGDSNRTDKVANTDKVKIVKVEINTT